MIREQPEDPRPYFCEQAALRSGLGWRSTLRADAEDAYLWGDFGCLPWVYEVSVQMARSLGDDDAL